ncbi:MAG: hypothetical protein ABIJ45_01935 [Candidatus Zixiibacteriota bacterium]
MRRLFLVLIFIIGGFLSLYANEVRQIADGLYETVPVDVTESIGSRSLISINAVPYLTGNINIMAGSDDELKFEYTKKIHVNSESKAIEYSKLIQVKSFSSPTGYNIVLQTPNPAPWNEASDIGKINVILYVPSECSIEINAVYFDLTVAGPISSVANQGSLGIMNIENITENLEISGSNRNMVLKNIGGNISILGKQSDIKAEHIRSGSKAAYIKNENGNIIIDNIIGAFEIKNSFGKIRINNADLYDIRSRIVSDQCPVKMEIVALRDAELIIGSNFGDVDLTVPEDISAVFDLNTETIGEIHLTGLAIVADKIRRNHLTARKGDENSIININNESGGDIIIHGE